MTTDTMFPTSDTRPSTETIDRSGIRTVLAIDAALALAAGALAAAAAGPIAEGAGLDSSTSLRWIGVGLLILGVDLAILSRAPERWVRRLAPVTAVGDVVWVVASIVVATTVDLATWAAVTVIAQAAAVGAIAAAKWVTLRR
ncbi:MAG: hypothetical protein ACXIVQ_16865 [Acidimicrobiales bacterium]